MIAPDDGRIFLNNETLAMKPIQCWHDLCCINAAIKQLSLFQNSKFSTNKFCFLTVWWTKTENWFNLSFGLNAAPQSENDANRKIIPVSECVLNTSTSLFKFYIQAIYNFRSVSNNGNLISIASRITGQIWRHRLKAWPLLSKGMTDISRLSHFQSGATPHQTKVTNNMFKFRISQQKQVSCWTVQLSEMSQQKKYNTLKLLSTSARTAGHDNLLSTSCKTSLKQTIRTHWLTKLLSLDYNWH